MTTYPIIIIEVPHQRPASGWTAHSASELVEACYSSYANGDDEVTSVVSIREQAAEDGDGKGYDEGLSEAYGDAAIIARDGLPEDQNA